VRLYRKKPVVISATQSTEKVEIQTLEGVMVANPGDWIITGVKGERYPCKPDIFEATYEPVTDQNSSQTGERGAEQEAEWRRKAASYIDHEYGDHQAWITSCAYLMEVLVDYERWKAERGGDAK
jgi:hypothetical protein